MSTEVVMPQMGESIAEGTITKWLKKVGERVERDENIFEISTDKVDAEIPSPAAGTLLEIRAQEGETVEVGKVVAVIGDGDGAQAATESPSAQAKPETAAQPAAQTPPAAKQPTPAQQTPAPAAQAASDAPAPPAPSSASAPTAAAAAPAQSSAQQATSAPAPPAPSAQTPSVPAAEEKPRGEQTVEELRRTRSSPLVRKIAAEHNIDITRLEGTGMSGRVTKNDIMSFIESGGPAAQARAPQQPPREAPGAPALPPLGEGDRVESMSVMRRKIADHMVMSRRTSAHVTTVYEIDMTRIARLRDKHKAAFQQSVGTKLTFMPFIFQAITQAIRRFPVFNAQVAGDQIVYKRDLNLGMAVALDGGLIVPVIKRADDLSIAGLAKAANDLADRARAKQLKPDEVAGGTFTITNPGVFGGLFGTPIINQPQVAILGVGAIEKRPKVLTTEDGDDLIAIRHMAFFALSFDHRIIDGADAERFLAYVKELLEAAQFIV